MTSPANLEELRRLHAGGSPLRYRFFLDYLPSPGQEVTDACLSQWWPCLFKVFGEYFTTAEHYMMYQKALLFGDTETAALILDADHPFIAKTLGRSVRQFSEPAWDRARLEVVIRGNMAKFQQNPILLDHLLSTGDDILAESSPVDHIWGTGCAADSSEAQNPSLWPGQNLLGFALMRVRDALKNGPAVNAARAASA